MSESDWSRVQSNVCIVWPSRPYSLNVNRIGIMKLDASIFACIGIPRFKKHCYCYNLDFVHTILTDNGKESARQLPYSSRVRYLVKEVEIRIQINRSI